LTKKRDNGIRKTLNAAVGMGGSGKGMNPRKYASKEDDQPKKPFLNNIRFQAAVALKRMLLEGLQTATNRKQKKVRTEGQDGMDRRCFTHRYCGFAICRLYR
jgi:hypothetical protein